MGTIAAALVLLTGLPAVSWARDPSTPPPLCDPVDRGERSPGTNPTRSQDPFESDTRNKSDEMLADAVLRSLADDPRVNAMRVHVDAAGGVVRLTGDVMSQDERQAAEEVARRVAGVRDVENRLTVSKGAAPAPGTSPIPERMGP